MRMPIKDSVTAFVVLSGRADSSVTGFTGNLAGANLLVGLLRLARFFVTYIGARCLDNHFYRLSLKRERARAI